MIAIFGMTMTVNAASYAHVGPFGHYNALGQSAAVAFSVITIAALYNMLSSLKKKGTASEVEAFLYKIFMVATAILSYGLGSRYRHARHMFRSRQVWRKL